MLGSSIFSSKEEKAAWTIQFFQFAAEKPGLSRDEIIELMQTEEATEIRQEFVRNHSPAEIEAIANKLRARIEEANEDSKDSQDVGDLTESEYDHLMKELETDRKFWAKEEANATAQVLSKIGTLEKNVQTEEDDNDDSPLGRVLGTEGQEIEQSSREEAELVNQRIKKHIGQVLEEENIEREKFIQGTVSNTLNEVNTNPESLTQLKRADVLITMLKLGLDSSANVESKFVQSLLEDLKPYIPVIEWYIIGKNYFEYLNDRIEYETNLETFFDEEVGEKTKRILTDPIQFLSVIREEEKNELRKVILTGLIERDRVSLVKEMDIMIRNLQREAVKTKTIHELNKVSDQLGIAFGLKAGLDPKYTQKKLGYYLDNL